MNKDIYSLEVEENIIGILLCYSDKIAEVITSISSSDFYDNKLQYLFDTIVTMYKTGKVIDIVTISEQVKFDNKLDFVGGREYINQLALNVITTANLKQLLKTLLKYSKKRKLINLINKTSESLYDNKDVDDILTDVNQEVNTLMYTQISSNLNSIFNGVKTVVEQIDKCYTNEDGLFGLSTGFPTLDKRIGGLCPNKLYILAARPRVGKALSLDTDILTPTGWIKNKDIKLGDIVIGRDGRPTKVIGVYPQGITNNYTLTLKDGRTIDCCEDHEWTVYSSKWGKERTFTTKELYNKLQCVGYKNRISLPKFTGDYGIEKNFIIPSYVMGVLIGDGCLTHGMYYCKPDTTILNKVQSLLPQADVHFGCDNKTVYITNFMEGLNYIRKIGLNTQSYNKFIPREYFHSSKEQRQELFNGLMDTDGHKFNTGWEYSTASKQLALDVQQLAWSLGYCAKTTTRIGKYKKGNQSKTTRLNYRVFITTHNPLTIVNIQPTKSFETQCIHVDNKDHLFVIKDYIVTHNSAITQQIAEYVAQKHNVLFHSLEMKLDQYTRRSLFRRAEITMEMITHRLITNEEVQNRLAEASKQLNSLNLLIDDTPIITLETVEKNINKIRKDKGSCDLVVIDYAQLMGSTNKKADRFQRATENSIGLKRLANKYNIPILLLCQLNRSIEQRADQTPQLSDLKDSGSYEQDADVIMFIDRKETYDKNPIHRGRASLIIGKNREGTCCTINMSFNGSKTEFKEI